MTHQLGRETGHLSTATLAQYKVRLKKLWKVYPYITDEKEKELCMKEMLKLSDKTGLELGGPTLMREPGRPRTRTDVTEDLQARVPEKLYDTSLEAHAFKEAESERELKRMQILAAHGVDVKEMQERNKRNQTESQMNKKEQELEQAMKDAVTAAQRYQETPLTDQEKELIEQAIRDSYKARAEEEFHEQGGDKGKPTGS